MKKLLLSLLLLILWCKVAFADIPIGTVVSQSGEVVIVRNNTTIPSYPGLRVEMGDEIRTGLSVVHITFLDETKVTITESSILVIDTFIYNKETPSGSKILFKIILGTIKYISGLISIENNEGVSIQTPSASIATRGTVFSSTVTDIGESKIMLLPNDNGDIGEIIVNTQYGVTTLKQPYEILILK